MVELWFAIFWAMVTTYVVLDGRTLGASALRPFVASGPDERREVLEAIGPMWSLYEVWLVGAGGVLLLAFPPVLAAAFSGYYLALFLILWLFVLRGISIELGHQLDHPLWQSFWNFVLSASSGAILLLLGLALGNVIRGVPLDEHGDFHLAFFTDFGPHGHVGLVDWYTLLIGALNLAALGAHGATFLANRTTGSVRTRSRTAAVFLWSATVVLGFAAALSTRSIRPDVWSALACRPLSLAFLLAASGGASAIVLGLRKDRDRVAFAGSCVLIVSLLGARAAATFPVLLFDTLGAEHSVSAFAAASRRDSLVIALTWWSIATPIAVLWHVLAIRSFRGRPDRTARIP